MEKGYLKMKLSKSIFLWGAIFSLMLTGLLTPLDAQAKKAFMWRVNSNAAVVYILGTIHMGVPEMHPMNPIIFDALDQADVLALEADLTDESRGELQQMVMKYGVYPQGENLNQNISDQTSMMAVKLDIDLTPVQTIRPWLAALALQVVKLMELGFEEKYGVEERLTEEARKTGQEIFELEGAAFQINLMRNLTDQEQDQLLFWTLVDLANMKDMIDQMVQAWKEGDQFAFEEVFFKGLEDHPELESLIDKLIYKRNIRMADQVEKFLKRGGTVLMAVGGGHLPGPKGVLKLLEDRGYAVEQPE